MNKTYLNLLIIMMSTAIIALVGIQVYWVKNALDLRQEEFERSAKEALLSVSNRLEHTEMLKQVKSHQQGRYLFLDERAEDKLTANGIDTSFEYMLVKQYTRDGKEVEVIINEEVAGERTSEITRKGTVDDTLETGDDFFRFEFTDRGSDRYLSSESPIMVDSLIREKLVEKRAFVGDIVKSLVEVNLFQPIEERISVDEVDSLINFELGQRGIRTPYQFGVFDSKGIIRLSNFKGDKQPSKMDHLVSRLYPNDIIRDPYFLRVWFPKQRSYLWSTSALMISSSLFIVLAIISIFIYTVQTIVSQKKNSEIKNDFINNMTHEFKTPISTISLACEALSDPDMRQLPTTLERYIGMIGEENKRLGLLVEEVLQSAIIDKGDFKLKLEEIEVNTLLQKVVDRMNLKVRERGGVIHFTPSVEAGIVMADRIHLSNVFYNLIDNANKYSQGAPKIEVWTTVRSETVSIAVKDYGIGISSDHQKRVFEKLYRVPTGNLHDVKGFGLGLNYVRVITERLGGQVRLDSQLGKGSTFTIEIPSYGN